MHSAIEVGERRCPDREHRDHDVDGARRHECRAQPERLDRRAGDEDAELVTHFAYGVLLARIPLFMFQAVQAALLPRLSRLAARGELADDCAVVVVKRTT